MDAIVYTDATIPSILSFLLDQKVPCPVTLIICMSKPTFAQQLDWALDKANPKQHHEIQSSQQSEALDVSIDVESADTRRPPESCQVEPAAALFTPPLHPILHRTSRKIAQSRNVRLLFIPSVPALLAYLTTLPAISDLEQGSPRPMLWLLNALNMHRRQSAFSAQSLSHTLAAAIEACVRSETALRIVECPVLRLRDEFDDDDDEHDSSEAEATEININPWDEKIPVLNSHTKTFGVGAMERSGFLARTVSIKDVVARWCVFKSLKVMTERTL